MTAKMHPGDDSPMTSTRAHYDRHLGPVYAWMAGGAGAAIARGAAELDAIGATPRDTKLAVDLGAGFGMHALPLAHRGFSVVAIDACAALLAEIEARKEASPIQAVQADLLSFRDHLPAQPELVLCMGDTVTHLPDEAAVTALIQAVAAVLAERGRLVLTFRDYSTPLCGERRFIPVRGDDTRILTCFLEYAETRVLVHDILHERDGAAWITRVSAYPKLRLAPEWVVGRLEDAGLRAERDISAAGMVRLVACRA